MDFLNDKMSSMLYIDSVSAGTIAVLLSFFADKIAPKLPPEVYKILDSDIVRIIIVAFLVEQKLRKPIYSILIAIVFILGFDIIMKIFAPQVPSLSEIVKPDDNGGRDKGDGDDNDGKENNCKKYTNTITIINKPQPSSDD